MQDRLAELRRQRALVADHLAWLDGEIAAATPAELATTVAAQPTPAIQIPPVVPTQPVVPPVGPAGAPLPLPEHRPADIKQDVRRGCFLYFGLALLLVVLAGALLVWASQAYKAKHPPVPRAERVE